ncbi:MAG: choice-of-anchor D domain-containing protein, partial [Acidobacteriia bacterium]|nr:choice-of-anchor D domain-containing protein [Terriglobia bacterium]
MTRCSFGCLLVICGLSPAVAEAQFTVSVVNGSAEQAVGSVYDFGTVASGDSASVHFRIRNSSSAAATLTVLQVSGTGFTLSGSPSIPDQLNSQAAADFVLNFQASANGGYSGTLSADGISVLLTATVGPGLTYSLQTTSGTQALGSNTSVNFGSVQVGQSVVLQFLVANSTQQSLTIPTIAISQGDFSLNGASPAGTALKPGQQPAKFSVQFQPTAAGARTGTLSIGSRSYPLTGTGTAAATPTPKVSVTLPQTGSPPQGSVSVTFTSPATVAGSGVLTMQFRPSVAGASDPSIVFASGGQTVPFTFSVGDTQATFGTQRSALFQTGTTAGTINFSVQLGGLSDQQTVTIAPAAVVFNSVQASRTPTSLQVSISGFDNTRSAGQMTFTFYDASSDIVGGGPVTANGTTAFSQYFASSVVGGSFHVQAVFPVTGDVSSITYVQASFVNSAGTATT